MSEHEQEGLFDAIRRLHDHMEFETLRETIWKQFGDQCAVLVMDSTGFTRVSKAKGIVYFLSCLVRMRDIVKPIFVQNQCVEYREEADNIFAVFASVEQALHTAMTVNSALDQAKIPLIGNDYLRLCTGIGFGRLLRSKHHGCFGDEMNLASKLGEDIATGGEILLTESAWSNVAQKDLWQVENRKMTISGVRVTYYCVSSRQI